MYFMYIYTVCRHAVYAPSIFNSYASSAFPGVTDAIYEEDWDLVKLQISKVALNILAAADVMTDSLQPAIFNVFGQ